MLSSSSHRISTETAALCIAGAQLQIVTFRCLDAIRHERRVAGACEPLAMGSRQASRMETCAWTAAV